MADIMKIFTDELGHYCEYNNVVARHCRSSKRPSGSAAMGAGQALIVTIGGAVLIYEISGD